MRGLFFIFIIFIMLTSCNKQSVNCGIECDYSPELIFQTGFNNSTIYSQTDVTDKITGTDTSFVIANSWEGFDSHENIGQFRINYEEGDTTQRYAKIINDYIDPTNKVLQFKIVEPHIQEGTKMKGRVNAYVSRNNCIKELYQTVRIYIHPDMEYLKQWDEKFSWLTLFEYWNNSGVYGEKYPFRVTVGLEKASGSGNNIYFHVKADKGGIFKWEAIWEESNLSFPVVFGEWMDIELYINEGDENNGRFYLAITPEGGSKQILFDITNTTQHPNDKCPDGYSEFNPMKLYTSGELIEFMNNNNKSLEVLWDDWKLYKNVSP